MSDPAICKVEDALAALISTAPSIAGWTIIAERSLDQAVSEEEWPAIVVYAVSYRIDQSDEQNQSIWTAIFELEFISGAPPIGTIGRANHTAIAHAHGVIASDRTLGGRVLDIQEVDVAPAQPNGKDVGSASLQYEVQFYTPRDDWFTLLGQGGTQF